MPYQPVEGRMINSSVQCFLFELTVREFFYFLPFTFYKQVAAQLALNKSFVGANCADSFLLFPCPVNSRAPHARPSSGCMILLTTAAEYEPLSITSERTYRRNPGSRLALKKKSLPMLFVISILQEL
jgi:hypothetical protein